MLAAVVEHVDENSRKAAREKHAEHNDNRDKSLVGLLLGRLWLSVNILLLGLSVDVLLFGMGIYVLLHRLRIIALRRIRRLRLTVSILREPRRLGSDERSVLIDRSVLHGIELLALGHLNRRNLNRLILLRLFGHQGLFGVEILRRHRRLKRLVRGLRSERLLLRDIPLSRL